MWGDEEDLNDSFSDIELHARKCRFNDCRHHNEPGCAVIAAIETGDLDSARLENYRKLQAELRYQASREENSLRLEEKAKRKRISRMGKQIEKHREEQ